MESIIYYVNGNRLEDGKYQYECKEVDQLVSITRKGESTPFVTYKYDEDGRRIQKNVNGVITNYHYQGDSLNVLYETDADGNVVRWYVYGANGQRLAMKTGNATYFYHYNAHGDVIALTDEQGNIVARYQYDAWGNILSQSGALAEENPYRYAGYQYDNETGLYYLIARYYHPEHGVFLSLDPSPGDADDILTQNGYTYANNNPVMYVDPDGNKSKRNNPADTVLSATTALVSLVTALREMGIYFLRVSWHAAERMVERKVVSKMIAKAIKHGKVYYDPWYGSYVYYYNGLAIAVTKDKIITTIYWGKPKKRWIKIK
jgi:RHS repeat-associated protein